VRALCEDPRHDGAHAVVDRQCKLIRSFYMYTLEEMQFEPRMHLRCVRTCVAMAPMRSPPAGCRATSLVAMAFITSAVTTPTTTCRLDGNFRRIWSCITSWLA